ncbi:LLM class flavin-dependent oxidoreductase [Paenibacillus hodogayensis]|uniref:LLM class flavin-dependent oxidoreductase n=1 Tax=Paenibacillus hodogayensis TaxID=279208 RepID=A0ABV5VRM2_9BACL
MTKRVGQMHISVALSGAGHHPGSWRSPAAEPDRLLDPHYYYRLARTADRAGFDLLVVDAPPALARPEAEGREPGLLLEPLTLLTALGSVTGRIGLAAEVETAVSEPFAAARILAVLDHLSAGRAAWQPVTTGQAEPHRPVQGRALHTEEELRARKREFVDVVRQLWDSWDEDALLVDKEAGRFIDPQKVRPIGHTGAYFRVQGPLSVPRPRQGRPLAISSHSGPGIPDASELEGTELAFLSFSGLSEAAAGYAELQCRVEGQGRPRGSVRALARLMPILAPTEAEARARAEQLRELAAWSLGTAFAAGSGEVAPLFVGTPRQLADLMEEWFVGRGCDGFHLHPAVLPTDLQQLADEVMPLLQARGLTRIADDATTLRGRLGLEFPPGPARTKEAYE